MKHIRRLFAILLILLWGGYAITNFVTRLPYLQLGYQQGWDISSRLDGVLGAADEGVLFQADIQNANGYLGHLLKRRTSNTDLTVVNGNDGRLNYSNFYSYASYSFEDAALAMKQIELMAEQQGASFLYVNCLDPLMTERENYGGITIAEMDERADAFLYYLNGNHVNNLDTRDILKQSELTDSQIRYNTDTRWTIPASFEVYLGVLADLKAQGTVVDPEGFYSEPDNFKRTEYPGRFLGDMGRQFGAPFMHNDDFTLITPDFASDFTLTHWFKGEQSLIKNGDFSQTLLDEGWLDAENPYERNMYNTYLTDEYPLRIIKNNLNPEGPKLLIVGDAYMHPVISFLATAASEIHIIWPYTLPESGTLVDYIGENDFDSVIIGMNPGKLDESGLGYLTGLDQK